MGIHDGHREKMRQRFLSGGLDHFADHEALELLLYYAIPRRDTNPIAHALMDRYGSLSAVLTAPVEDLKKVEGIGDSAAILLRLAPQVYQKAQLAEYERDLPMSSVTAVGKYVVDRFIGERNEVIYQLCLDQKAKLLACKRLGEGGVTSADLDIRKMMEHVIATGASAVILAHNHPSGVATPSDDDWVATRKARAALQTIHVALIDHLVVADGDFVSMRQTRREEFD